MRRVKSTAVWHQQHWRGVAKPAFSRLILHTFVAIDLINTSSVGPLSEKHAKALTASSCDDKSSLRGWTSGALLSARCHQLSKLAGIELRAHMCRSALRKDNDGRVEKGEAGS